MKSGLLRCISFLVFVLTLYFVMCPDCRLEAQYAHQQGVMMLPLVRLDDASARRVLRVARLWLLVP